jgi:hypothetical protein
MGAHVTCWSPAGFVMLGDVNTQITGGVRGATMQSSSCTCQPAGAPAAQLWRKSRAKYRHGRMSPQACLPMVSQGQAGSYGGCIRLATQQRRIRMKQTSHAPASHSPARRSTYTGPCICVLCFEWQAVACTNKQAIDCGASWIQLTGPGSLSCRRHVELMRARAWLGLCCSMLAAGWRQQHNPDP